MNRYFSVIIALSLVFFSASVSHASVDFTDEQIQNLDVIDGVMRTKFPDSFKGFKAKGNKVNALGVSDKDLEKELNKINLSQAIDNDPGRNKIKAIVQNMRAVGLTDDTIEFLTRLDMTQFP